MNPDPIPAAPAAAPAEAARAAIRGNAHGVAPSCSVERFELMLPMDDGVRLRTVVFRPVGAGPWPTAFTRGPYPLQEPVKEALGAEYASRGMAYVYQYCRGKGGSEGTFVANVNERADGIASLNWLNAQPWVRSIGMHGHSYLALTTWIVGDRLPEKVRALHVQCYGALRNLSVSHSGLVACDNIIAWTLLNCTDRFRYDDYIASAQYLPNVRVDRDLWGGQVEGYADWIDHPDFTDPYWEEGVWGELRSAVAGIQVPVTVFCGYYDHHFEGTVAAWELLPPETRAKSRLVLGCWNHRFGNPVAWKRGKTWQKNVDADTFDWFYSILVRGALPPAGVEAYVVGEDRWMHREDFPPATGSARTWYLTDEAAAVPSGSASLLSPERPQAESVRTYRYDPADPKWAEGGECFLYSNGELNADSSRYPTGDLRGSHALSAPGYRSDVLSFVSEPLTEDLTLAGKLEANLFVSSDAGDTAFTFVISEVDENGLAHNIRNGLLTLAYRHDRYDAAVNDYVPGEIAELRMESLPIVWRIPAGHAIRVDISSSDFPEFTNHTNRVGRWAEQTGYQVANQTICIGGAHASSVTLPILSD